MQFPGPLVTGVLTLRYKRFLADVRLDDGSQITATCPNTGSMLGLCDPGTRIWLSTSDKATRKYRHTWEISEQDLGKGRKLVGINTGLPNRLVEEAIVSGRIEELRGHTDLRREVKYGRENSRVDLLLTYPAGRQCYVEVKNVHLSRRAGLAEFPDCVSARASKHLRELSAMAGLGHRAVMVFLIQRSDTSRFRLAADLDPGYAAAFARARQTGVEAIAYACSVQPDAIAVDRAVPIEA